jgi:hypothetical protein
VLKVSLYVAILREALGIQFSSPLLRDIPLVVISASPKSDSRTSRSGRVRVELVGLKKVMTMTVTIK